MNDNTSLKRSLSIIIPCYKSERTIGLVISEIKTNRFVCSFNNFEIIAVDDGSPDHVHDVLAEMAAQDRRIKVISFTKNFGQHAAMMAGLKKASGDICVFLDDDGQCPIDKIEELIIPIMQGYDISIAQYGKKKQKLYKNIGSWFNGVIANWLTYKPKNIQMGNYIAFNRIVANEMTRYRGPYPYVSGLLFRSSGRVINVPMEELERQEGGTTYTIRKLIALWANGFTAFSIKPLRFASFLGVCVSVGGILYTILLVIRKILQPSIMIGWSSIMAVILIIGGVILFVLGLIGEYVGRIYMSLNETPQYVIRKKINID